MDDDLKEMAQFIAILLGGILLIIAAIIGGRLLYIHTIDRAACADFKEQNPQTQTFFSVSTGCTYNRDGAGYWFKL